MKIALIARWILLLGMVYCFCACAGKQRIDGAWKLVANNPQRDTVVQRVPAHFQQIKLIAGNRFCWTIYDRGERMIRNGAAGTFTQQGDRYVEHIESALPGMASFVGKEAAYTYEIRDSLMRIDGMLDGNTRVIEIWKRIE